MLARWNDCRYYPAKILSIKKNGAFRVLFYDGIEKSVQPFNVREMSAELKAQVRCLCLLHYSVYPFCLMCKIVGTEIVL